MSRKLTTDEFIRKAKAIHGNKYNYDNVEYTDSKNKVLIKCDIHGLFKQRPNDHLNGNGCPLCNTKHKSNTEEYIKKASFVHNEYFDYSKTVYTNANSKITVTCPIHGDFEVKANNHLSGQNCMKCKNSGIIHKITKLPKNKNRTKKLTIHEIEERIDQLSNGMYSIVDLNYQNNQSKIKLFCNETDEFGFKHGEFEITPLHLFAGERCQKCSKNKRITNKEFIDKANIIHDNEYDYSKTNYTSTHNNVIITCKKHGDFLQSPANHLRGQGCPACSKSKLENEVKSALQSQSILFEEEKTFTWLKYKNNLYLDFFLPDYNMAIECQGEQHFRPIKFSNRINENILYDLVKKRDETKNKLCREHGIKILYYANTTDLEYEFPLILSIQELIQKIKTN